MLEKLKQYLLDNGYIYNGTMDFMGKEYEKKGVKVKIKGDKVRVYSGKYKENKPFKLLDQYYSIILDTQKDLDMFIKMIEYIEGWVSE